jgi:hypothetical protein
MTVAAAVTVSVTVAESIPIPIPMRWFVPVTVSDDRGSERFFPRDRAYRAPGGRAMHVIVHSLDLEFRSALSTMCVLGNRRAQQFRVPSPGPEAGWRSTDQRGHHVLLPLLTVLIGRRWGADGDPEGRYRG